MIIEEIMHTDVVTLTEDATIKTAIKMLEENRIRHIPVIDENNHLIGIVTDRDIRDAKPSIFHSDEHKEDLLKPISTIMERDVFTAHPLDFVEEVSAIFYEHNIGCLPIVEDDKLIGIITETDIFHTLVKLMGAHQPSSHIEVQVENITGKLSEIAAIFKKRKVNITSVLVYPCKDIQYKTLVFRVQTMDPRAIIADIEKEGYKVLWPNMPGVIE
ncbi:acetoin utilization AcuB family protein [Desertibacillus haloalkaliphilus]|uniref:acetoin utilization AcuB family protein n=1 Tax=Desertibacillus haloalkaliphilus TaxID=1328930 RepID=UPI001C27352A|nr:acetoin utilization AcuB family protein [Desertibacillus haloalkaliphilus]MBU8905211.1 acetoin utilization AcuB family protein [Desertibacillus haloalkaliphilus]